MFNFLNNTIKTMKVLQFAVIVAFFALITIDLNAQCETWVGSPNEDAASSAHTVYRDFYKAQDYVKAFPEWKKAFDLAPAADGKRDFHYSDGVDIYMDMYKNEADATKKAEYKKTILEMYDAWAGCMDSGSIQLPNINIDEYIGYIRGREAFNMFYTLNVPYSKNIATLDEAIEKAGNTAEYIIFEPYANIVVYEFTNENMTKEKARDIYTKLNAIADHNIENNEQLSEAYSASKERMNAKFREIENSIFDCEYFKARWVPEYKKKMSDGEEVAKIIKELLKRGCDQSDPMIMEMQTRYSAYADSTNTARQDEFNRNNPGALASKLYKDGDYTGAIKKWEEAMGTHPENAAEYNYWIANTKLWKLKTTSGVLAHARKATSGKFAGKAYILMGDTYARMSRGCGDSWQQRLAILAALDKYSYAKSVDGSVAEDANRKIANYNASRPERQEGFMRKVKEGQKVKSKCTGETVKVRFSD